ncbi:MAG: sodium:proton antiporter [Acidobacteriota bacterium]
MSLLAVAGVLITLTALLAWLNERTLRLPPAIGVMVGGFLASLAVLGLGAAGFGTREWAGQLLARVPFDDLLMEGMLSYLLFAGALHVDLSELLRQRWTVLTLATVGVVFSTFLVGGAIVFLLPLLGLALPFAFALLFGSLISPTDPIAVLAILKKAGAPSELRSLITGESLFNDGVGVVVFSVIAGIAVHGRQLDPASIGLLFVEEAIGGVIFGLGLGFVAYHLLRRVDDHSVEVLITLATVQGGYALALALHTSGPIAMVVAGLFIGNRGRMFAMSDNVRRRLDEFWEMTDEILNAILFLIIGLEVLVLDWSPAKIIAGLVAIPLVLGARWLTVGGAVTARRRRRTFPPGTVRLMTWGGLRGGISVALALSLPPSSERDLIVAITYVVVFFSILVQGLTVGPLVRLLSHPKTVPGGTAA